MLIIRTFYYITRTILLPRQQQMTQHHLAIVYLVLVPQCNAKERVVFGLFCALFVLKRSRHRGKVYPASPFLQEMIQETPRE